MYLHKDDCDARLTARKSEVSARMADQTRERMATQEYRTEIVERLRNPETRAKAEKIRLAKYDKRRAEKGLPPRSVTQNYAQHCGVADRRVVLMIVKGMPCNPSGLDFASCDAWRMEQKKQRSTKMTARMYERYTDPNVRTKVSEENRSRHAKLRAEKRLPTTSAMKKYASHRGITIDHANNLLRQGLPHDGSGDLDHTICDVWMEKRKAKMLAGRAERMSARHANPEFRAKAARQFHKINANPEFRAKNAEKMRAPEAIAKRVASYNATIAKRRADKEACHAVD